MIASPLAFAADWPSAVELFELPEGFAQQIVTRGFTGATAMALLPDGRVLVCQQTGELRVVKDGRLLDEPALVLPVDSYWERGLIGITLDPHFADRGHVYLCYVAARPHPHHRVSRFTLVGERIDPASERLLWQGDDQTKLGGSVPAGHQGGAVRFGGDGKLYIALGEQTAGAPSQRLDSFLGKLLRINPDGSIPDDNPFAGQAEGKYRAIYARGLRNPFMLAVDPGSGRMLINDVGGSRWEEINEAAAGANYGWPAREGPGHDERFAPPLFAYAESPKQSITGGAFYRPQQKTFPEGYYGKYFFADYMFGWIRVLDEQVPGTLRVPLAADGTRSVPTTLGDGTKSVPAALPFASNLPGPVDLQVAADGSLYVLCRNAWVKDDKFQPGTGSLHRIVYVGSDAAAARMTRQPADVTVAADESARFSVEARGEGLEYRWLQNGKWLGQGRSAELLLPLVDQRDDGARLQCILRSADGFQRSRTVRLWVTKLRQPVEAENIAAGLKLQVHAGRWPHLPALERQTLVGEGIAQRIDPRITDRERDFAMSLRGLVKIDQPGAHTFHVRSSGAAKLYVAGSQVAAIGIASGPRESSGVVGLRAGYHPLRLDFAHADGPPRLKVEIESADLPRRELTAEMLFHAASGAADVRPPRPLAPTVFVPDDPAHLPPLLSQTGIFRSLDDLSVQPGVVPYDVNSPLWSDGAEKRRWLIVPPGERIEWSAAGPWRFPAGTVLVKHFELPGRKLETRLLVVDRDGLGYGVTYKWREDGSDAELLAEGLTEALPDRGGEKPVWSYPSRQDCLVCHTPQAGFLLGVNTRQLNAPRQSENQLVALSQLGLLSTNLSLEKVGSLPRLPAPDDASQPLAERVRSYLDANCAQCHQPGGVRAEFDARYSTPLDKQNLIRGKLIAADLGNSGAKVVVPGKPEQSMLLLRMRRRQDAFNMPPLASHVVDRQAVELVREWIQTLPQQ